jgi:hypothetical protein
LPIIRVDQVVVAVADFELACRNWRAAGFSLGIERNGQQGVQSASCAAGAVKVRLCAAQRPATIVDPIASRVSQAAARGGGIIGWVW